MEKKSQARMLDRCAKKAVNALMEICSDQGKYMAHQPVHLKES